MRILFIINSLVIGGAEKVFMLEARELRARGHEVHMLLLFKFGELVDSVGIPSEYVHVARMSSVFDIFGFFRALRIVRTVRPDVAYSTLNEGNFVARLLALFTMRARLVTREANMADVKPRLYRWGDILFGLRSSTIVAVSKAVGNSLSAYAPHLKNKMCVLYNPIGISSGTARSPRQGVRLLSVGSLTPKKDQQVLVRALAHLPKDVSLTLVGDGQERQELGRLAQGLSIADRVTFAGAVPPEKVGEYYKSHDIFVLTSSHEGCPNVVLEALSYRLPVVAFDIPGMSEFVSSEWGVLVHERDPKVLADTLLPLIRSADSRTAMGDAGHIHVSNKHSVGQHVSELEKMLSLSRT